MSNIPTGGCYANITMHIAHYINATEVRKTVSFTWGGYYDVYLSSVVGQMAD